MSREIILDTETTGISPAEGHRIVEIGAIELLNHVPTGRTFHVYINPERDMPKEAEAVHGLSSAFLKDKPVFKAIAQDFLDFLGDAVLVIHNAGFDMAFINAELSYLDLPAIDMGQVVDTLAMARRKHPMASNSLDALCKRYGIDNSKRTRHGALLDAELLADVYIELLGGRQTALNLVGTGGVADRISISVTKITSVVQPRPEPLAPRLSEEERKAHQALVESLGPTALWSQASTVLN
ncbi:MAG: DNA polymerase III subunit epsilon [Rhizobiales bacterium]|nr:DNA polymerase III subunit epsilon [Hyphomicrobiales bacterium]